MNHPEPTRPRFGEVDINGSVFITSLTAKPCFVCGEPTHLIEINFEANAHVDCAERAWQEVLQGDLPPDEEEEPISDILAREAEEAESVAEAEEEAHASTAQGEVPPVEAGEVDHQ